MSAATVRRDIQRSSNYVLGVVLFSVALFFAGMSTKLSDTRLRKITLALGYIVFLGTLDLDRHIPGELRGLEGQRRRLPLRLHDLQLRPSLQWEVDEVRARVDGDGVGRGCQKGLS